MAVAAAYGYRLLTLPAHAAGFVCFSPMTKGVNKVCDTMEQHVGSSR